jgi:hypothetical protein
MENLKNISRKRIQQEKKKKINDMLHDSKVIKHQNTHSTRSKYDYCSFGEFGMVYRCQQPIQDIL